MSALIKLRFGFFWHKHGLHGPIAFFRSVFWGTMINFGRVEPDRQAPYPDLDCQSPSSVSIPRPSLKIVALSNVLESLLESCWKRLQEVRKQKSHRPQGAVANF